MSGLKINEDTILKDLIEALPESKKLLKKYGYEKFEKDGIEDIVIDKLSIKGFCRLMEVGEEECLKLIRDLQSLYNKKLEEAR